MSTAEMVKFWFIKEAMPLLIIFGILFSLLLGIYILSLAQIAWTWVRKHLSWKRRRG